MCQCRFISYSKCTTLMWDIDKGGVGGGLKGDRRYMGMLYLLLNFAVNLKLLQKKKQTNKKKNTLYLKGGEKKKVTFKSDFEIIWDKK